jgi:aminoglycoside 3-N-acetyltransferase
VPAYFYEYARQGISFDVEMSPVSLSLGAFSRYIATLPGRARSCNPLQSLAAIGGQAAKLIGGESLSGYGVTSPWHRLKSMDGKMVFLGVTLQPMTFVHYIEQQYGVPHLYCKIYSTPVLRNGVALEGAPISAVRYLEFEVEYDLAPFEHLLQQQGKLSSVKVGSGVIHCVTARDAYETGIACLDKNPYFFLKKPPRFVRGKIPCDGFTGRLSD